MYAASPARYSTLPYHRCGKSGLKLPAISLGMWQNFGDYKPYDNSRKMALRAFDLGVTHFDLANNYGPTPGSAEETMFSSMTVVPATLHRGLSWISRPRQWP